VAHLRVFGCLCFAKELNQVRKLDDRSRPGVFLGYAEGAKAYCVYDPMSRRVLVSRALTTAGHHAYRVTLASSGGVW